MDQLVVPGACMAAAGTTEPLFTSGWWLHAASGGQYETVRIAWDGQTVGELSFLRVRRLGMTCLRMPPYTRTLGPVLTLPPSKPIQRSANIRRIVKEIVQKLPTHDEFATTLDPAAEAAIALAFDVVNYHVCQAFTFRIEANEDIDLRWSNLDKRTRNIIRSASRRFTALESADFDRFERLSRKEHADDRTTHDYVILRRLYQEAAARGQAMLHLAVQDDGTDAAALILVWDADVVYYWTSARNHAANGGGANALLLWEAIRFANQRGLAIDFDGYCTPGAARFLSGFVWHPLVRPVVTSFSARYKLARIAQDILRWRPHPPNRVASLENPV